MTGTVKRYLATFALLTLAVPASAGQEPRPQGEERREQWQKVGEIFDAMLVKPGSVVADVGAGDGFFTQRLAAAVGPQGRVLAVDIGADALRRLRKRVSDQALSNVEVIEGAADDPKLPAGSVDAILIVNAYHEMTEHQAVLAKLKAALKPDGRLVIVEPIAPSRRGRPRAEQTKNHEIDVEYVKQETREAGFTQVAMQDPFTTRQHAHGGTADEEWMLVLTPGTARTGAAAAWAASKKGDWQAPGLRITPAEFKTLHAAGKVLTLDVRDEESFRAGHLPGALLMTIEELASPAGIAKLKGEARVIVAYCS